MSKPLIVVNFKTYESASSQNANTLASAMESVTSDSVEIVAVTSAFDLSVLKMQKM